MSNDNLSRRAFIHNTSIASAATIVAALAKSGNASALPIDKKKIDTPKILNYNPKMGYRRLGKTGLMISEVSLGGHWRLEGALARQQRRLVVGPIHKRASARRRRQKSHRGRLQGHRLRHELSGHHRRRGMSLLRRGVKGPT